jgi:hypothetical protein
MPTPIIMVDPPFLNFWLFVVIVVVVVGAIVGVALFSQK